MSTMPLTVLHRAVRNGAKPVDVSGTLLYAAVWKNDRFKILTDSVLKLYVCMHLCMDNNPCTLMDNVVLNF